MALVRCILGKFLGVACHCFIRSIGKKKGEGKEWGEIEQT